MLVAIARGSNVIHVVIQMPYVADEHAQFNFPFLAFAIAIVAIILKV